MDLKDSFDDMISTSQGYLIRTAETTELKWLAEGYAVEYIETNDKVEVIGFFEPQDFILASHPGSMIASLGQCQLLSITKEKLIFMLRTCYETAIYHKEFKKRYLAKLAAYRGSLRKSSAERYLILLERYPWIQQEATPEMICSYLKIPLKQYLEMIAVT